MPADAIPDRLTLEAERIAVGGDAIGHAPDGRVVFVSGLLPGEHATVRLRSQRTRQLRAEIVADAFSHIMLPTTSGASSPYRVRTDVSGSARHGNGA